MTEPTPDLRPEPPPARRRFVLARLADAVRRQDWFTVLVEIAVVVLGVVIGFQVTAWGQARSDRAKEQTYLRQLAADLRQTQREVARVDSVLAPSEVAMSRLFRAFYASQLPPTDSVIAWVERSYLVSVVLPVTGTAEALVATGDLGLIRDDSLRSAITTYLQTAEQSVIIQSSNREAWHRDYGVVRSEIDPYDLAQTYFTPSVVDSLSRNNPDFILPPERERSPYRFRADAFLSDVDIHQALFRVFTSKQSLGRYRTRLHEASGELLLRVEAQIEP